MKLTVHGYQISTGTSSKTGKPYDMSQIFVMLPMQQDENTKGSAGSSYYVPAHLLEKFKNVNLPVDCELEVTDVMRYGNRQQQVSAITLLSAARKTATV